MTRKLAPQLAVIFNTCLKGASFSGMLEISADVVAVPKGSSSQDVGGETPLLPFCTSKIFEKIVAGKLVFFKSNHLPPPSQVFVS